jgi:peptidoglycan/LPS O-acetylase OafA/YrhL
MNDKPNLDLLRAVAVTCVVTAHILAGMDRGQWGHFSILDIGPFGVYLFFVHTSLVLMWSLERRPNTLDFYVRRAFRLYPLAIAAILLAAATHAPVSSISNHGQFTAYPATLYNVVTGCLLVDGLLGHGRLLLGQTWSLSPEMFMYILLPALFFYAKAVKKVWPLFIVWLLVVLLDRRIFPPENGSAFGVLVPDFICGVIAYVGFMRRRETLPSFVLLPLLALLFCALEFINIPTFRTVWFACLALGLLLPRIRQFQSITAKRLTHAVAKYSYGIYLFHTFTIYLGVHLLAKYSIPVQLAVVILPLIPVVYLAYHFIEEPMIKLGARVAAKWAHERGLPSEKSLENLEPAP